MDSEEEMLRVAVTHPNIDLLKILVKFDHGLDAYRLTKELGLTYRYGNPGSGGNRPITENGVPGILGIGGHGTQGAAGASVPGPNFGLQGCGLSNCGGGAGLLNSGGSGAGVPPSILNQGGTGGNGVGPGGAP